MARIDRKVHGVPVWLMREYLIDLGGIAQDVGPSNPANEVEEIVGDGWVAHFQRVEDFCIGFLRVGVVHLEIDGDEEVLASLRPRLGLKFMRAGG